MSANVVNDPSTVIESDRPHKSSMSLTRSTADKASSVPRRRLVIDYKIFIYFGYDQNYSHSLLMLIDIPFFTILMQVRVQNGIQKKFSPILSL